MSSHLNDLVALQKALDSLASAERQIAGVPDWMQELHVEHSARQDEIDLIQADVEAAAAERRSAEAQVEDLQAKLKRYQDQISLVQTQREYGAILQEIDVAKAQIKELEEQAFGAMERQDEGRSGLETERQAFRELDERYKGELQKWESEKPGLQQQAEKLRDQVRLYRESIPAVQLAQFDRLLQRHAGQALAPVVRLTRPGKGALAWHCGACHYSVRPQAAVDVQTNGSLVQCDGCRRFLFAEETTP